MNAAVIHALGQIKPFVTKDTNGSSTISASSNGIIVSLSNDGKLYYVLSSSMEENIAPALLLFSSADSENFLKFNYSNIAFNNDGSLLLLWSSTSVGIVEVKICSRTRQINTNLSRFTVIVDNTKAQSEKIPIVKAKFHLHSSTHVVTLYSRGCLLLTDAISKQTVSIPLNQEYTFVSFDFGPTIDWMAAAAFLLDSRGDVFILCPLLPHGSSISLGVIEDMYLWLEEERLLTEERQRSVALHRYYSTAKSYLTKTFRNVHDVTDRSAMVSAFISDASVEVSQSVLDTPLKLGLGFLSSFSELNLETPNEGSLGSHLPALQGPMKIKKQSRKDACDICVPRGPVSTQLSATPVLLISYCDSTVDSYLIGCSPSSPNDYSCDWRSVGPAWLQSAKDCDEEIEGTHALLRYPVPDLTPVETVCIAESLQLDSATAPGYWHLESDPVFSHCIHVSNQKECSALLLSMPWLADLITQQNRVNRRADKLRARSQHKGIILDHTRRRVNQESRNYETIGRYEITDPLEVDITANTSFRYNDSFQASSPSPYPISALRNNFMPSVSATKKDTNIRMQPLTPNPSRGYFGVDLDDDDDNDFKEDTPEPDIVEEIEEIEVDRSANTGGRDVDEYHEDNYDGNGMEDCTEQANVLQKFRHTRVLPVFTPLRSSEVMGAVNCMELTGMSVRYSAINGHTALCQTSTGMIGSVNLTAHIHFCESQITLQEALESSSAPSRWGVDLQVALRQQQLHEAAVASLFSTALQGLSQVPVGGSVATQKVGDTSNLSSATVSALLRAKAHLEKEVFLPLQAVGQRLAFRRESLEALHRIQMELLCGVNPTDDEKKQAISRGDKFVDSDGKGGLSKILEDLKKESEETVEKVKTMQERQVEQRAKLDELLSAVLYLRSKVSPAEREYYQQLKQMSSASTQVEARLIALQEQQQRWLDGQAQKHCTDTVDGSSPVAMFAQSTTEATSTRMRMTPETSATATSARATAEGGVRRNIYASPVFRTPYRGPPGSLGMTPATASSAVYSLPRRPTDVNRLGIGIAPLSRVSVTPMRGSFAIAPAEPSSSTSHTPAVPSDADLDYCVKTQSSQTEMLRATVIEIKELEFRLQRIKKKVTEDY